MELYAIVCRACHALFHIHRCCYRGHAYCGDACRAIGRRWTANTANRTYRESDEGRLDHQDAERARRARRREDALGQGEQRREDALGQGEQRREDALGQGEQHREDALGVADQGSKKLTSPAHLVGESEVQDETRPDDDTARAGAWRCVYAAAAERHVAHGAATPRRSAIRAGAGLLEWLAGLVCVVCGRGGGPLVRLVDGPDGRHLRAAPGAALSQ